MADARPINDGVRNAINGTLADVIYKHRKDPFVSSETIADRIIDALLDNDGLLADLLIEGAE